MHVEETVGSVKWTEHGNVDWGFVKGWVSHAYLKAVIKSYWIPEYMPFCNTFSSLQGQRQKTKLGYIIFCFC